MLTILEKIEKILRSVASRIMTHSIIENRCKEMSIEPADITEDNLPKFAEILRLPLRSFYGIQISNKIVEEIKNIVKDIKNLA